jgi:hypothetical protein
MTPPPAAPAVPPTTPAPSDGVRPAEAPPATSRAPSPAPPADQAAVRVVEEVVTEMVLTDGRRLEGVLVEQTPLHVTLRIEGIATQFPRASINRIRTLPSVEQQYANSRATIRDLDFLERVKLAQWVRSKERFDLALAELEGVLALDPRNVEALELRTEVLLEQALAARRGKAPPAGPDRANERPAPKQPAQPEFPLLSLEEINLIRVYELDLGANPRLLVPREAIEALVRDHGGRANIPTSREGRDAFLRRPPAEIVRAMFDVQARELYPSVSVLDHPPALRMFRDDVHQSWLLNSCATTACHGGNEAGRLMLANRGAPDRVAYTNFFILDKFKLADGRPLIDYSRPTESPLLRMAMPREPGVAGHPDVVVGRNKVRWRAVLTGPNDPRYTKVVHWIESMYRPRPEYPVGYRPPEAMPRESQER